MANCEWRRGTAGPPLKLDDCSLRVTHSTLKWPGLVVGQRRQPCIASRGAVNFVDTTNKISPVIKRDRAIPYLGLHTHITQRWKGMAMVGAAQARPWFESTNRFQSLFVKRINSTFSLNSCFLRACCATHYALVPRMALTGSGTTNLAWRESWGTSPSTAVLSACPQPQYCCTSTVNVCGFFS